VSEGAGFHTQMRPNIPDLDIIPGMLLTVAEAAELLRVSRKTVYRWIEEGKLRACVIRLPSGRIRIDRDLLCSYRLLFLAGLSLFLLIKAGTWSLRFMSSPIELRNGEGSEDVYAALRAAQDLNRYIVKASLGIKE